MAQIGEVSCSVVKSLIGERNFDLWQSIIDKINTHYDVDQVWFDGGKAWSWEYKFRKGGKTLCSLLARENLISLMIIFGKEERQRFEGCRESFSQFIQDIFDSSQTYHDGKWMLFEIKDDLLFEEYLKLLTIKRKPNKNNLI